MVIVENACKFLSPNKAAQLRNGAFKDIKKLVVLWPNKHPLSRIEVNDFKFEPPYGDVIGFDELVSRVRDHRWNSTIPAPFEPGEMVRLANALRCEPPGGENVQIPDPMTPFEGEGPQDESRKQPEQHGNRRSANGERRHQKEDSKQGDSSQTSRRPQQKPPVEKPGPKSSSVPIGWALALIGAFVVLFLFVGVLDFNKPVTAGVENTHPAEPDRQRPDMETTYVTKEMVGTRQRHVLLIESVGIYRERWIYLNAPDSNVAVEVFGTSPQNLAARKKHYEEFVGKKVAVEGLIKADRNGNPQISIPDSKADSRIQVRE